jgi:hypothetical protein
MCSYRGQAAMVGKGLQAMADLGLPIPTRIFAWWAKPLGGFGLVAGSFTNRYQALACEPPLRMVVLVWWSGDLPIVTMPPF